MSNQSPLVHWQVEFYADPRGKSPVVDFINGLPVQDRVRVRNALRLLREFGILLRLPHARPISGQPKLWELLAGGVRLFYFAHAGRRFIVLHGFRKKSAKTPAREIATAVRRMSRFLESGE